jgi:hypothetical protein
MDLRRPTTANQAKPTHKAKTTNSKTTVGWVKAASQPSKSSIGRGALAWVKVVMGQKRGKF